MRDDDDDDPAGFLGDDAGRASLGRLIPPPLNRNDRLEAFTDNSRNGLE